MDEEYFDEEIRHYIGFRFLYCQTKIQFFWMIFHSVYLLEEVIVVNRKGIVEVTQAEMSNKLVKLLFLDKVLQFK